MARGVIAAGNPLTVEAGADVLRAGGTAVDAAVAALATSLVAEPLLTGLGAGGYMLVAGPGIEPALLDFSVEAPGRGGDPHAREELVPVDVSFGDAVQVFHVGPSSVACYGTPAGIWEASRRYGSMPLGELMAPAARLAREGVVITAEQAYVFEVLAPIITLEPEARELFAPAGRLLGAGDRLHWPALGEALERLGREGPKPFYHGDIARDVAGVMAARGGLLTLEDLAAYRVVRRPPVTAGYRGRTVVTNPPPSAGGTLIAYVLARLEAGPAPPTEEGLVAAMEAAQAQRTPEFLAALSEGGTRLGSTTHVSVIDAEGRACAVTTSNGEGAGIVVPGTGLHLNNMLGEQDLNPLGFHRHPPGRRLPSMMAPTAVLDAGGGPELVLGSGGSNRIRSALVQTIVNVLDHGMPVEEAVVAPRLHFEDGVVYVEPGVDTTVLESLGHGLARFRGRNLFFGGVHAVTARPLAGGGDPRRGGAAAVV